MHKVVDGNVRKLLTRLTNNNNANDDGIDLTGLSAFQCLCEWIEGELAKVVDESFL